MGGRRNFRVYSILTVFHTTIIALANTITENECLAMQSAVVVDDVGCFVAYDTGGAVDYRNAEYICSYGLESEGRLAVLNTKMAFEGVVNSEMFEFMSPLNYHVGLEKQSGLILNSSSYYNGWQWYDSSLENNSVVNFYDHFTTEGAKLGNNSQAVNTSESLRGYLVAISHRLPDNTILYKNNLVDYEAFPNEDRLSNSYGGVLCEYPLTSLTTKTTTTTSTSSLSSISVTTSTTATDIPALNTSTIMVSTTKFTAYEFIIPTTLAATSAKMPLTTNTPTPTLDTTELSSIAQPSLETPFKRLPTAARFRMHQPNSINFLKQSGVTNQVNLMNCVRKCKSTPECSTIHSDNNTPQCVLLKEATEVVVPYDINPNSGLYYDADENTEDGIKGVGNQWVKIDDEL